MDTLIRFCEVGLAVVGGILARLGVVILALAALAVPVLLAIGLMRGYSWLRRRAKGVQLAGGLCYRPGLLYARGHTWVRKEHGEARVGVDDLVRRILPWAVSVRLPRLGDALKAGDPVVTISTGREEAVIRAPLDGTVTGINPRLEGSPSLVKSDGYTTGWLFSMRPSRGYEGLKQDPEARVWMTAEGDRLHRWVETRLGTAAADGGELIDPIASHLDPAEWKALTEKFLA
jgi:glycine cleavage system H protein